MIDLPSEIQHLPLDSRSGRPVPYVAEQPPEKDRVNFGVLDRQRAERCYLNRLCGMCGLKMGKEVAIFGDEVSLARDGFYIEPPVHERCLEIALGGVCPYLSQESYPRRRQDEPDVLVMGDRDALREVGRSIPKRPSIVAIAEQYQMVLMGIPDGQSFRLMPVYTAPRVLRVRRFGWVDGKATEVIPREVVRGSQPRRQSRSQRKR